MKLEEAISELEQRVEFAKEYADHVPQYAEALETAVAAMKEKLHGCVWKKTEEHSPTEEGAYLLMRKNGNLIKCEFVPAGGLNGTVPEVGYWLTEHGELLPLEFAEYWMLVKKPIQEERVIKLQMPELPKEEIC